MELGKPFRSCILLALGIAVTAFGADAAKADEAAAIRAQIDAYVAAWNRGDAGALGAFYDEDYDWMNPLGMHLYGRDTVVAYQTSSFQRQLPPGVTHSLKYDVQGIRLITDDVAVVDVRYTGTGMGLHPERPVNAMIMSVYVKKGGRWLRASQRNFILIRPPS